MAARGARLTVCSSHAIPPPPGDPSWPFPAMPEIWEAWAVARAAIEAFDPEVVVFFGIDHRRAFRSVIPSVAVALHATARGDRGGPLGTYSVAGDLARDVANHLSSRDVDLAVAYDVALDHGFGHSARDLLGGIDRYPLVPIFLNSASPPAPSFRRAATIGDVVGSFFDGRAERVLFVGTGGLTHHLPGFLPPDDGADLTEEERLELYGRLNRELFDPTLVFDGSWDREFLAGVQGSGRDWLGPIGTDVVRRGGNGANEAVSWVAAWAAGGRPLRVLAHRFDPVMGGNGAAVALSV
ncbi:MAG: hypothetical protein U0Q03_18545 [Acidimicrobiales bacterium]